MFEEIIHTKNLTVFQLRAARRALNLTVREVAKDTGLSIGVIVRAETGSLKLFPQKTNLISAARLKSYYEAYHIIFLSNNTISLKEAEDIVLRKVISIKN
ncbi:MAG: hypothetical protein HEEMFOPI_01509 [Holosporales bacterium]